jgi:hypothetical protein
MCRSQPRPSYIRSSADWCGYSWHSRSAVMCTASRAALSMSERWRRPTSSKVSIPLSATRSSSWARRCGAGNNACRGVPNVAAMIGHTRISTTLEIYTDTDDQARRDALTGYTACLARPKVARLMRHLINPAAAQIPMTIPASPKKINETPSPITPESPPLANHMPRATNIMPPIIPHWAVLWGDQLVAASTE